MLASQESPKATPIMAKMAKEKVNQKAKEKPKEKEKQAPKKSMPTPPVMPVATGKEAMLIKHRHLGNMHVPRRQQPPRHTVPVLSNGHGRMTMAGGHPNGMRTGTPAMSIIRV